MDTTTQQFQAVHTHNQWGHVTFTTDDNEPFLPPAGSSLSIRFPSGATEDVQVLYRTQTSTVHDMGHTTTVRSTIPGFLLTHEGLELWVNLHEVEVSV